MTPQDFIEDYLGCSAEELCNWMEKVDRLPWAGSAEILEWMEEYGKQQWNEAINKVANNCEEYSTINEHGEETEFICFIEKEDVLKLLK